MKKITKEILSGIFVSSLILGGIATSTTTVRADDTPTTTAATNDQVTNTIVFKDMNGKTISSGKISGQAVGDPITQKIFNTIRPDGYALLYNDETVFQKDGSTQTVTAMPGGRHPLYGVLKVNSKILNHDYTAKLGAPFYLLAGTDNEEFPPKLYGLAIGTEWKFFEISVVGDNEFYYRVDNSDDWISSKNSSIVSINEINGYNSIQKSDVSIVTTRNKITYLTKQNGQTVKNRALAPYTPWYTDKMALINGVKMYRVATDEWVKQSDITDAIFD